MKDAIVIVAIAITMVVSAFILLFMPWLIEYMEVYFQWVRSHFNN